jgi:AraC-like DNA-binding protein
MARTPRDYCVPLHQHTYYEAIIMLDGQAWETTATRQRLLPGALLLHAPQRAHSWASPGATVTRLGLWFTLTPALSVPRPAIWPVSPAALAQSAALLQEAQTLTPGWHDRAAARLVLVLAELLALADWPAGVGEPPMPPNDRTAPLVEQFLCDNLAQPLTLQDIAGQVGMSVPSLTRHFRRESGVSVMARLEALRLEEAARLLRHTTATAAAIGAQVGLSEPSYFGRRFRQRFGHTPQQYRQQPPAPTP